MNSDPFHWPDRQAGIRECAIDRSRGAPSFSDQCCPDHARVGRPLEHSVTELVGEAALRRIRASAWMVPTHAQSCALSIKSRSSSVAAPSERVIEGPPATIETIQLSQQHSAETSLPQTAGSASASLESRGRQLTNHNNSPAALRKTAIIFASLCCTATAVGAATPLFAATSPVAASQMGGDMTVASRTGPAAANPLRADRNA